LLLVTIGCQPPGKRAEKEAADGNFPEAAKLFWQAALDAPCPERGRFLLRRAQIQGQAGYDDLNGATIDQAIRSCPELPDGYWLRAQRNRDRGDREQAMNDARFARSYFPEARTMYSELAMELETERSIREHAQKLITELQAALDPTKPRRKLPGREAVTLTRQVPLPLTLRYQVSQRATEPARFELEWQEVISYRGDSAASTYALVRHLNLPPMEKELPLYHRLQLANQRLPMVFEINADGEVSEARWLTKGPDRGMRPEMLRPEIDAMLKRRRLFDSGEDGRRAPGDRWAGADVKVVDGKPIQLRYQSRAEAWVEMSGVRTLQIHTVLSGDGYSAQEKHWLHPKTAVTVRWSRTANYTVTTRAGPQRWQEQIEANLVSVAGTE
jgi:tetratricopeptide (TPR) repeat protein